MRTRSDVLNTTGTIHDMLTQRAESLAQIQIELLLDIRDQNERIIELLEIAGSDIVKRFQDSTKNWKRDAQTSTRESE